MRKRHGHTDGGILGMAEFGALGLQKFAPRGGVEKQILGINHRAARQCRRLDGTHFARQHLHAKRMGRIHPATGVARGQGQA